MVQTVQAVREQLVEPEVRQLPVVPVALPMVVDLSDGTIRRELSVIHLRGVTLPFLVVLEELVALEAVVVMVAQVLQRARAVPEELREQVVRVRLVELSMAVDLRATISEQSRMIIH